VVPYKLVTQRRVNFTPAGETYAAVLVFNGGTIEVPGNQARVDDSLPYAFVLPGRSSAFPTNGKHIGRRIQLSFTPRSKLGARS
jgi:hypothetical protein